jgi:hypothetical protein
MHENFGEGLRHWINSWGASFCRWRENDWVPPHCAFVSASRIWAITRVRVE